MWVDVKKGWGKRGVGGGNEKHVEEQRGEGERERHARAADIQISILSTNRIVRKIIWTKTIQRNHSLKNVVQALLIKHNKQKRTIKTEQIDKEKISIALQEAAEGGEDAIVGNFGYYNI